MNERELSALSYAKGARTLVVIYSHMGNSSAISFTTIPTEKCDGFSLKLNILRVRLRRELTSKSRVPRIEELFVLKSKGGNELLTKKLAEFLEGNLIETADNKEMHDRFSNTCVVLKTEETPTESILRFVNAKSTEEYGPQITIKR